MARCAINLCTRQPGVGTHTRIRLSPQQSTTHAEIMVAVCEEHWQAIRAVPYVDPQNTPVVREV